MSHLAWKAQRECILLRVKEKHNALVLEIEKKGAEEGKKNMDDNTYDSLEQKKYKEIKCSKVVLDTKVSKLNILRNTTE